MVMRLLMSIMVTFLVLLQQTDPRVVAANLTVWRHECDDVNGNYTVNSPYKNNLGSLLSRVTKTNINYGFYNLSSGKSPNIVNLISLCQGDVDINTCHTCQLAVIDKLKSMCPNQKTAIAFSDDCIVRYSSEPIFGVLQESPYFEMNSRKLPVSNVEQYNEVVWKLLEGLPARASSGDSRHKFATWQADVNSTVTVYAAAQCTPDLSQKDCLKCLDDAVMELKSRGSGKQGARFLFPSCFVRFEEYKFYLSTAFDFRPSNDSVPSSTIGNERGDRTLVIILAVCTGSLSITLVVVILFAVLRKRVSRNLLPTKLNDERDISKVDSLRFELSKIIAATENFSEANKLGSGECGDLYKGTMSNGQEIAIRRLGRDSSQDEDGFKNELALIAKLHHKNLVKFLGFCLENEERLLIYEFAPNSSLDRYLFDASRRAHLDWQTRYKIIQGIARGMLYLHHDSRLRIVHRDLRASNILLDAEMCPKITGFGTAKLFDADQTHSEASRIVGRRAYMAPEYELYGYFSTKSDVYSFGVLLLEIVSGRKCCGSYTAESSESLVNMAWRKWSEGTPLEVVDPAILEGSEAEIVRCIQIGLLCVQDKLADRPTMASVDLMLSGESLALPLPCPPSYAMSRSMSLDSRAWNHSIAMPAEELE